MILTKLTNNNKIATSLPLISKVLQIILFICLLVIAAVTVMVITGWPQQLRLFVVETGSMSPEIRPGNLIIAVKQESYNLNDIITFRGKVTPNSENLYNITHRIIEIKEENDQTKFVTKGDANLSEDQVEITADQIIGKVNFAIPYLGNIVNITRSKIGFFILIGLPSLFIISNELQTIKVELKRITSPEDKPKNNSTGRIKYSLLAAVIIFSGINLLINPAQAVFSTSVEIHNNSISMISSQIYTNPYRIIKNNGNNPPDLLASRSTDTETNRGKVPTLDDINSTSGTKEDTTNNEPASHLVTRPTMSDNTNEDENKINDEVSETPYEDIENTESEIANPNPSPKEPTIEPVYSEPESQNNPNDDLGALSKNEVKSDNDQNSESEPNPIPVQESESKIESVVKTPSETSSAVSSEPPINKSENQHTKDSADDTNKHAVTEPEFKPEQKTQKIPAEDSTTEDSEEIVQAKASGPES